MKVTLIIPRRDKNCTGKIGFRKNGISDSFTVLFYCQKKNDTYVKVQIQWDSIPIADVEKNRFDMPVYQKFYYNLVAVYAGGKSDFLKGWTRCHPSGLNVKFDKSSGAIFQNTLTFRKSPIGSFLIFNSLIKQLSSFTLIIYEINGR